MNGEQNNTHSSITWVVTSIIILVLIVLGLVAWNRSTESVPVDETLNDGVANGGSALEQQAALVSYSFNNGVHTYTGTIQAPTPCHTVTYEVQLSEEAPITPTIHFTIHNPTLDQVCTQVITEIPFTVEFEAPENSAQAQATLGGKPFFLIIGGKE